jgi:uncharacterized protein
MRIIIAGSSGLIGSAVAEYFEEQGAQLIRLERGSDNALMINQADFEGADGVINLAGENIASGRWTAAKKQRLVASRLSTTQQLAEAIAAAKRPPQVWINGSAIGFYGDRGDAILTEESDPGTGFLADLCVQWEAAAKASVRVVKLRTGVVLSSQGGALAKMVTPFKLGLGGQIGDGKQYMSWIALEDQVRAIDFILRTPAISGAVNLVADAVTNAEFTKTLGKVLHRPTVFRVPASIARLAFGEMADQMLLASTRVKPQKLTDSGFVIAYPKLEEALRIELGFKNLLSQ